MNVLWTSRNTTWIARTYKRPTSWHSSTTAASLLFSISRVVDGETVNLYSEGVPNQELQDTQTILLCCRYLRTTGRLV